MIARILGIFRKDLRRLWANVVLFWYIMAMSAIVASITPDRLDVRTSLPIATCLRVLQVLACLVLIVLLIQQERLVGDRQYWLARPFGWKELLGAKALFLITTVNVPLMIYHCA